jgi:hypothetical protein
MRVLDSKHIRITNSRGTEAHALYARSKIGREDETDGTTIQKIVQGRIPPRRNKEDFMRKYIIL